MIFIFLSILKFTASNYYTLYTYIFIVKLYLFLSAIIIVGEYVFKIFSGRFPVFCCFVFHDIFYWTFQSLIITYTTIVIINKVVQHQTPQLVKILSLVITTYKMYTHSSCVISAHLCHFSSSLDTA